MIDGGSVSVEVGGHWLVVLLVCDEVMVGSAAEVLDSVTEGPVDEMTDSEGTAEDSLGMAEVEVGAGVSVEVGTGVSELRWWCELCQRSSLGIDMLKLSWGRVANEMVEEGAPVEEGTRVAEAEAEPVAEADAEAEKSFEAVAEGPAERVDE